jgi:FkbM family methyltransferase
MSLKALLRDSLRKSGYLIQKYPVVSFPTVRVFDLSVQLLMALKGEALNFIQVGANDGDFGDPLRRYILKFPWRGVLVEPQPDVFAKLLKNYSSVKDRLIFENVAIGSGVSSIAMYRAPGKHASGSQSDTHAASVVSVNPRVAARQLGVRPTDLEKFLVPCVTLDELVARHGMLAIDILQIDTEGHDFNVLKTMDLSKTTPLIIQFEHGHLTRREINDAVSYLIAHGYQVLYGGYQTDTLALHKSFPSSLS